MNIVSYNLNGIRAAERKGLSEWMAAENPDIICFQELKANEDQVDLAVFKDLGYHIYWHSAEKKGYSGVAIFSKVKPKHVEVGCGIDIYDREGRVIRADFETFSIMSTYMPSGSSGEQRQAFKIKWLVDFQAYIADLKVSHPNLIISGDYNICHQAVDIHDPTRNKNSSGFLPEERAWVTDFLKNGFVDSFRRIYPDAKDTYSWWSYRANARNNNKGWRIDYHMVSKEIEDRIHGAEILANVKHSDHCPVKLVLSSVS
ncbi:MAG: exodeoxyribonuclease-3 [Marivirga sp.]|jgi:exodeoxyribonuclease-3